MPIDRIRRNRFYEPPYTFNHTSQNHHDDFVDYFLPQDRIQNANLRLWGIAGGLTVTGPAGAAELTIAPGAAIDAGGRLIALADGGTGDIGVNPPGAQHQEVPVPVALPLAGHAGQQCYVTIAYSEILRINEGSGGRLEVVPWLRLQPVAGAGAYVDDGNSVILAIVDIAGNGTVSQLLATDPTLPHGRRLAAKPTGAVHVRTPRVSGNIAGEADGGTLVGREGGGLRLTVPGAGDVVAVERGNGANFARLETRANTVAMRDSAGRDALNLNAGAARLNVGANGNAGELRVLDGAGRAAFSFDSATAWLRVGAQNNEGDIAVHDSQDRQVLHFDGGAGRLRVGTEGREGNVEVRDGQNRQVFSVDGASAWVRIGNTENEGDLAVHDAQNRRAFHVDGGNAWVQIGAQGNEGDLAIHDDQNRRVFHFSGSNAWLDLGADGNEGDLGVLDGRGARTIHLNGDSGQVIAEELWANGRRIDGNPARQVSWGSLFVNVNGGTTTREFDLGATRRIFGYIVPVFLDPSIDFDRDNYLAAEVYEVDGVRVSTWLSGGDHFGGEGATSNYHLPAWSGSARRVTFRLRCPGDCAAAAVGVIFWA